MSNWKTFKGNELEWDSLVHQFEGDYRQLWQWGEYKRSVNWKVIRYIKNCDIGKNCKEIMQVTYKQMWPICFIYIPGGICNESRTGFSEDIEKIFYNKFRYFISIIRVDSHYSQSKSLSEKLLTNGWYVPLYRNNVGLASIIQINHLEGINKFTNASSKWKYNFRRGLKNNLIFNTDEKLNLIKNEITKVANEMIEYKNVYHIINPSAILDIADYFREKLIIVTCRNSHNKIIAFRAALCVNNFAWDLFAASNEEGRKLKAGYLLLSKLIDECRSKGAKKYSLAGITPGTARSVFKIEAGGSLYPFVGEYEKSKILILGKIFNFLLYSTKFSLSYRLINFFLRIIKSREK